jgi:hypothetical protein
VNLRDNSHLRRVGQSDHNLSLADWSAFFDEEIAAGASTIAIVGVDNLSGDRSCHHAIPDLLFDFREANFVELQGLRP